MRILLLSPYLAHSEIGHGGGISTYHFARHLARRHELTLLCFARADERGRERELQRAGVRVVTVPFLSPSDHGVRRLAFLADRALVRMRAWARGRPSFAEKYGRDAMREVLLELLAQDEFDVVQAEYEAMGSYLETIRAWLESRPGPHPRLLLNTHEAGVLPRQRRLARASGPERMRLQRSLTTWERMVRKTVSAADRVQCVTPQDRDLLAELVDESQRAKLRVLPFGVDVEGLPPSSVAVGPRRLVFVGSYGHAPNVDAARLLIDEVFPRLKQSFPELECELVGRGLPEELQARMGAGLRWLGFVEELGEVFDGAWIFAAPIYSGGGIKIKILEAMGRGAAILSSPMGLEGIELDMGTHAVSAANVLEFVDEANALLGDPDRLRRLGAAAREQAEARYGWEIIVERWESELAQD